MLCDAFSELGRLPARPSPVQPGIIARENSLANKKWLKYASNCPIPAQARLVFASKADADLLVQMIQSAQFFLTVDIGAAGGAN